MNKMILLAAGVCQGSFGLGYKDYRPFSWALFWLSYNLLCLAVAGIWAFAQVPGLAAVYGAHGGEALVKEFSPARYGPEKMARLESALRRQILSGKRASPALPSASAAGRLFLSALLLLGRHLRQ